MADVFVSYKREDRDAVGRIVAALRAAGLSVWWDVDIAPRAPWESTIEAQLGQARAVVVAWTQSSVSSENVKAEARKAHRDGRLVQVFLDACDPPLFFGERQGIDLSKWSGDAAEPECGALVCAVQGAASAKNRDSLEVATMGRRRKTRWPLVVAASICGSAVAAVGVWLFAIPHESEARTLSALEGTWGRPGCPLPQHFSISGREISVRSGDWTSTGRVVSVADGAVLSETLSPVEDRGRLIELRPEGDRMQIHDRTTDVRQVLERCP